MTVTAESQTTPTSTASAESGGEGQSYNGNGGKSLGTITVDKESTLEWTNDGSVFQIYTSEGVPVNSQAHSGTTGWKLSIRAFRLTRSGTGRSR